MNLKEIMAISGHPGLYRHISQGRNGIIVESLTDKKRMMAYVTMKVSSLEDISVFTDDGELPLKEVFKKIYEKESGGPVKYQKSNPDEIKKYFEEVLPEYEKEKVYPSDIRKILNWYNILQELNMLEFEDNNPADEESSDDSEQKADNAE